MAEYNINKIKLPNGDICNLKDYNPILLYNDFDQINDGYALDAKAGKILKDEIEELTLTKDVNGQEVVFTNEMPNTPLRSLKVDIEPIQDLHGYDYPWIGGTEHNFFEIKDISGTYHNTVDFSVNNGVITVNGTNDSSGIMITNTAIGATSITDQRDYKKHLPDGDYFLYFLSRNSKIGIQIYGYNSAEDSLHNILPSATNNTNFTITDEYLYNYIRIYVSSGTYEDVSIQPMILKEEDTSRDWSPYSNICPITGYSNINIFVTNTESLQNYNVSFNSVGTVYGGILNVTTGLLTITKGFIPINAAWSLSNDNSYAYINVSNIKKAEATNLTPANNIICNKLKKIAPNKIGDINGISVSASFSRILASIVGSTDINDYKELQICYDLEEPITVQLTPTQILTLSGSNDIVADNYANINLTYQLNDKLGINKLINDLQNKIEQLNIRISELENN